MGSQITFQAGDGGPGVTFFSQEWFHDFPDRAHRQLLLNRANLAELLGQADPARAAGLDVSRARVLDRELPLPDWRHREVGLFFEVPFREPPEAGPALLCLVLEHQSGVDQAIPLRLLLEAVLYWERRWQRWTQRRQRGERLQLPVVWPVVFHTGVQPWEGPRELGELFVVPEAYRGLIPRWPPLFWDLVGQTAEQLLASPGEWLKAMAVVRAERAERDVFTAVFAEALARLEPLAERDKMRWQEMLWFLLSYAVQRRPDAERADLFTASLASHHAVTLKQEVQTMSEQVLETYGEWSRRHFTAIGREEGRQEGRLITLRALLRGLLEQRFGTLPQPLLDRIAAAEDADRLQAAVLRVHQVGSPDELTL